MSKLFSWLKPTGNPPVNGYDLSKRETFSFVPGMLNLSYQRLLMPKTHVSLKLGAIINSMPMVNQNFSRGQFVTDVYQVPLNQLWDGFNEFYAQTLEKFSSADISELVSSCANVNLLNLYQLIAHDVIALANTKFTDGVKFSVSYDEWLLNIESSLNDESVQWLSLGLDVHGIPVCLGAMRLLDMAGFGNLELLIRSWFEFLSSGNSYISDTYDSDSSIMSDDSVMSFLFVYDMIFRPMYDLPFSNDSAFSSVFALWIAEAPAMLMDSVYRSFVSSLHAIDSSKAKNFPDNLPLVSVWPLLAYQKVFNDIYRNTFYDEPNVISFNLDKVFDNNDIIQSDADTYVSTRDIGKVLISFLTIHYRQFKNDMFTCLLPNSQMGEVAMVSAGDSAYNISLFEADDTLNVRTKDGVLQAYAAGVTKDNWRLSPTPAFSVLVQRRAEALQKYKERYLRAGNRLKDQFISTFGKVPYYLEDKYVRYLGTLSGQLGLQGVPATNDTGDYNVGERAAYGVGSIQDQIEFACDDFSIVIAITYYLPELDYESFALDAAHTYSEPFDFPVPEFENIGLQPIYRNSLSLASTMAYDETEQSLIEILGNRVIGFGPAYMAWKTDVDRLHGEFGSFVTLNKKRVNGIFSSWVTSRGNVSMTELGDYYVRPDFMNSLMVAQYHGWSGQDPFVAVFNWDIKISQPLSVVGLPIWN